MVRARFKVKGEVKRDLPWPRKFFSGPKIILSVMDDAGQGRARCRKAREGFAYPLSLPLLIRIRIRIRIRIKEERLLIYHSISSSGSPRLLVAFSSGAGSRIPHLMSDRSKVVLQVLLELIQNGEILSTLVNCTVGHWAAGLSCCQWLHCARSSSALRREGLTLRPSPPPTAGGSWARWRRCWRRWRRRDWQRPRWTRANSTGTGRWVYPLHLLCCSPAPVFHIVRQVGSKHKKQSYGLMNKPGLGRCQCWSLVLHFPLHLIHPVPPAPMVISNEMEKCVDFKGVAHKLDMFGHLMYPRFLVSFQVRACLESWERRNWQLTSTNFDVSLYLFWFATKPFEQRAQ